MRKRLLLGVVIVAVIAGLVALQPWGRDAPASEVEQDAVATTQRRAPIGSHTSWAKVAQPGPVTAKKKNITAKERERYLRAIRDAMDRRASTTPPDAPKPGPVPTDERAQPGTESLVDRSGGTLAGLMKDLQRDVMPLADECYALALERDPTLAGGLDLQFEIIGDQDVGGLVERVDVEESSQIQDLEMIECMRETLLSTVFPAPDDSGAAGVRLTLQFDPDDAG